jgi:hypothetical protein
MALACQSQCRLNERESLSNADWMKRSIHSRDLRLPAKSEQSCLICGVAPQQLFEPKGNELAPLPTNQQLGKGNTHRLEWSIMRWRLEGGSPVVCSILGRSNSQVWRSKRWQVFKMFHKNNL